MPKMIKSLKLKGQFFNESTNLNIFLKKENRLSIIYGRNGSGKSSIARAIEYYYRSKPDSKWKFDFVDFYDYNSTKIQRNQMDYNIYVFDENFINEKIHIKDDGLESIVMFGEQVELDNLIDSKNQDINSKKEELQTLTSLLEEKENPNSQNSYKYYLEKMKVLLRQDDGWAAIDKEIKKNKANSSVNDRLVLEIAKNKPTLPQNQLKIEFENLKANYDSIKDEVERLDKPVNLIKEEYNDLMIMSLLAQKIEEPKLTSREEKILNSIKKEGQKLMQEAKKRFINKEVEICPYCFRKISEEEIEILLSCFDNVLNKDVEEHEEKLKKYKLDLIEMDLEVYNKLDNQIICEIRKKLDEFNKTIEIYNTYIDQKINNPFKPLEIENLGLSSKIKGINLKLESLEENRLDYNKSIGQIEEIKEKLIDQNKELAYFQIKDYYDIYKNKYEEYNNMQKRKHQIENDISLIKIEIDQLKCKKNNIEIAIDVINKSLSYVFYDKNRMQLVPSGDNYFLKVRGRAVTPDKVSVGERNILALCYFFTMIGENLDKENMYSEKTLLVIDDPISSFDSDNRIGILSYLNKEVKNIIFGNKNSRIILMSHDVLVTDSLIKIGDDIANSLKYRNMPSKSIYSRLEIRNKEIFEYKKVDQNEYSVSLSKIYEFIEGETNDVTIGNIMRRVLEAFTTFEYKVSVNEILSKDDIMLQIKDLNQREKLQNYMSRILLNEESHSEMKVKSMENIGLASTYSLEEKQRTGKSILCLIYLLNPYHLKYHLNDSSKLENIELWCEELKS